MGGQYRKYMVQSPTDGCIVHNQYGQCNTTFLVAMSARQKVNSNVMLVKKWSLLKNFDSCYETVFLLTFLSPVPLPHPQDLLKQKEWFFLLPALLGSQCHKP